MIPICECEHSDNRIQRNIRTILEFIDVSERGPGLA